MGITIDKQEATLRFSQALTLAGSPDTPLPPEWIKRAEVIGSAENKTFIPVFGTALLAKATDDSVDALSLRADESHKGYSARSVAKNILMPCCANAGIDLRNKGGEPLNNQPFLRAARISNALNVRPNAKAELKYLVASVERADFLSAPKALEALAAFLRVRIMASRIATRVELGPGVLDLPTLISALDKLVDGENEGGRVGQAIVAAAMELVFADVRTKKINDPSNKWPGDVGVFDKGAQTLSAEVKQRPMKESDILLFSQRLREAGLHRGFVVMLDQQRTPLDLHTLEHQANRLHAVALTFFTRAGELLKAAAGFAASGLPLLLTRFPRDVLKRMEEIEVSDSKMKEWAALFAAPTPSPAPGEKNS